MQALLSRPIADAIASHLGLDPDTVAPLVAPPTKVGAGDFALPCFVLAKERGVPPPKLAAELAALLPQRLPGLQATATGPFLNLSWPPETVATTILGALERHPQAALRSDEGAGRTVCIDFSSPNIAKHLAFHHIRSTGIGNALSRCYEAAGWTVVRINFLGDWGTAFGRLIAGWKREGLSLEDVARSADPVAFFNQLYVRISQEGKEDERVAEEAREWSRRCEAGDPEALELWQVIRDASLAAARQIYALLDIDFDDWRGEAHYRNSGHEVAEELAAAGLLQEDAGAQVVDLSDQGLDKPCLILRQDGATLYATRDLAACEDRYRSYGFARSIYVVDLGQSLHFREWFGVARKLGKPYAEALRHVGFGVVQMWNEEEQRWAKTATRNGVPMMLMDVLQEAIARAATVVAEKNPELDPAERAQVARAVGLGAVLFNDLKNGRRNDIRFSFEDALNMQGDTGPYLQFAHARLCSIERRFAGTFPDAGPGDPALLVRDDEKAVLLQIARMQGALLTAVENDEPSQLAQALLALATVISSWLTGGSKDPSARVIGDDAALSAARVRLVAAARTTVGEGLRLLGLIAPERM